MASGPTTSWQVEEEKVEAVTDSISVGSKITVDGDCSHKIKRHLLLGRKAMRSLLLFFSHLVMFDTLWSHGLQHTGFPCPSPSPGACLNSCLLIRWCHPTISSSVIPFSSSLQYFPASGSLLLNQFILSGGQSIGACFSISPSSDYSGLISFRIDCFDLAVQGTLESPNNNSKASVLQCSAFFMVFFLYCMVLIPHLIVIRLSYKISAKCLAQKRVQLNISSLSPNLPFPIL